jgi:hypothetical protein
MAMIPLAGLVVVAKHSNANKFRRTSISIQLFPASMRHHVAALERIGRIAL